MITINGLTERQVELLDIMWSIDDPEDYENWKSTLTESTMNMVDTLEQMVLYATLDEELEESQDFTDALSILQRYRG